MLINLRITYAENFTKNSKQIEVKYFSINGNYEKEITDIIKIYTKFDLADSLMLTDSLDKTTFLKKQDRVKINLEHLSSAENIVLVKISTDCKFEACLKFSPVFL